MQYLPARFVCVTALRTYKQLKEKMDQIKVWLQQDNEQPSASFLIPPSTQSPLLRLNGQFTALSILLFSRTSWCDC